MKRFVEGEDRSQATLLPEYLDDYIGADNPVRVINPFVEKLTTPTISFPIIAGAGTLTTLLSLRAEYVHVENIIVAILINLVIVYLVLRNMFRLEKLLGPGGISLLKKVFGIILLALAVKLFKNNT